MEENFASRLNKAMLLRNIKATELAEKAKIPKSAISQYLSGLYEAKQKSIFKLALALNVSEGWLMGLDVPMERTPNNQAIKVDNNIDISDIKNVNVALNKFYWCPVYGEISAGQPNWAEECIETYLPIDPQLMGIINPEEHYFLKVKGESMNNVIANGAFALIHKQDYVENGEIAVVLVNGDNATLKIFQKKGDIIVLSPDSSDKNFEQQIYTKETPVRVIGKYVGKMEVNSNKKK